jgi:hypothetical protein
MPPRSQRARAAASAARRFASGAPKLRISAGTATLRARLGGDTPSRASGAGRRAYRRSVVNGNSRPTENTLNSATSLPGIASNHVAAHKIIL